MGLRAQALAEHSARLVLVSVAFDFEPLRLLSFLRSDDIGKFSLQLLLRFVRSKQLDCCRCLNIQILSIQEGQRSSIQNRHPAARRLLASHRLLELARFRQAHARYVLLEGLSRSFWGIWRVEELVFRCTFSALGLSLNGDTGKARFFILSGITDLKLCSVCVWLGVAAHVPRDADCALAWQGSLRAVLIERVFNFGAELC